MTALCTRRQFLRHAAACSTAAVGLAGTSRAADQEPEPKPAFSSLTLISGKPRERGRQYGQKFKDGIKSFLDKEIYAALEKHFKRDTQLRYAGQCSKVIKEVSPIIHDEMEGMAEGSGLSLEALVLITSHEELYHKGALPSVDHCHVAAAGPPVTTGDTYVGQTWDWMQSVHGLSTMLHWKRPEGPSLLAYGFPGLWVGAGLNSTGLSLCWTSAFNDRDGNKTPRVGVPAYVLLTHFLYQDSLKSVIEEARRNKHAGWFTFVLADGDGNLLNVEGSPKEIVVEQARGLMVRHQFTTRQLTGTPEGQPVKLLRSAPFIIEQLEAGKGKVDHGTIQNVLAHDRVGDHCIDLMVFNNSRRQAHLSRGPGKRAKWQTFTFDTK